MKLSILVCSLLKRSNYLDRLNANLDYQLTDEVQYLTCIDNGEQSIGTKRNLLLDKAEGDYICFIDDDDLVAPNYVELILKAISGKPDVVGMNLIMTTDGNKAERSFHSLQIKSWYDRPDPLGEHKRVYFRNPNHINPVKRELALQIKFPEISMGEDKVYSDKLLPLLNTESWIDQPIYFYLYRSNK